MNFDMPDTLYYLVGMALLVLGTARFVRLITYDAYPPTKWIREKWETWVNEDWQPLMTCPFCFAPYVAAVNMAYAYFSDLHWSWWVLNIWGAVSYLAAIVVAYDQPEE